MRATAPTLAAGISFVGWLPAFRAPAADGDALGEVIVTATRQIAAPTGYAVSEGTTTQEKLANSPAAAPGARARSRTGPRLTQHSGDGKDNQYLLRGFNLDHATDFAPFVDGVPVICRPMHTGRATASSTS